MPEYLDCKGAADVAKCSVFHIREAIKAGELKAYRPARSYIIKPADLDEWIKSRVVNKKSGA